MLIADPKTSERMECGAENSRRVYFLKIPTVGERNRYRAAVARAGGRRHAPYAMLNALGAAVREAAEEGVADVLLAAIEAHRDALTALAEFARDYDGAPTVSEDAKAQWAVLSADGAKTERALMPIIEAAREGGTRYAAMEADNIAYFGFAGLEAARMFLTGWEGLSVPFPRRGKDKPLAEDALAAIPERDLSEIGAFAEGMMNLSERQRKNSSSPSATPSDGSISNSTNTATNGDATSSALPGTSSTLLN